MFSRCDVDEITVDENGFVFVGGLKVCRLTNMQMLEFYDRDRRRSDERGSHFVYVTPERFAKAIQEALQ